MAKQVISIGATPNDGSGDPLRTAFQKVNSNFTELYTAAVDNPYQLPVATNSVLGGVRIGNGITIFNGVISVATQVQPDWNATSGLGQILNKPAENTLKNGIYTLSLSSAGVLSVPGDLQLTDQKQVTSLNANVNNGLGGTGRVGWFNHPNVNYLDGVNIKVWGLYTEGDIILRTSDGVSSAPYWQFLKSGNVVLPNSGDIKNSDGTSYLNYTNLINKPQNIATVVGSTPPASKVGASGDKVGDIRIDANYAYFCTAAYDGTSNIWVRVAIDTSWV